MLTFGFVDTSGLLISPKQYETTKGDSINAVMMGLNLLGRLHYVTTYLYAAIYHYSFKFKRTINL